jgi:hypothetical protein
MAREIHKFAVTVPAGTLRSAPQVSNLNMPDREITRVTIIVPPGTRGLLGFALGAAGVPFIPYEPGQFFVTDDEKIDWPLEGQITSGAWQCFAYNTGQYAHTLEFRFFANLAPEPGAVSAGLLPAELLSSGGGTGTGAPTPETPPAAGLALGPGRPAPTPAPAQPGPLATPPATLATVGFRPRR